MAEARRIAEIQGLYGPLSVPESLIQKIWLRGDFQTARLTTIRQRALRIVAPGRWNLQEGPDFRDAQLEIGGRKVIGDVEVHFYMQDWYRHGHHLDPAFDGVVLHVVLFAPTLQDRLSKTSRGRTPHHLVLLPWLHQNIEEYANEEALLSLEQRDQREIAIPLLETPIEERRTELVGRARNRWRQKCDYLRERIRKDGWEEACHQSLMEVLGYRRNRQPMLQLAIRYPFPVMRSGHRDWERYYQELAGLWKLSGTRPSNHPRKRLQQYLQVLGEEGSWPRRLFDCGAQIAPASSNRLDTATFRRDFKMKQLRAVLRREVLASALAGTRLDTIICDAFLPLLSARREADLVHWWLHWYGGDVPDSCRRLLREVDLIDGRRWPTSNGAYQGILQHLLDSIE